MKWRGRETSQNVDDRRGGGGKKGIAFGGVGIIIAVIAYFISGDPTQLLQVVQQQATQTEQTHIPTTEENEAAQFVSVVLKDTEDVWDKIFREQLNESYSKPQLVLFTNEVQSACGFASAASDFLAWQIRSVVIELSFRL